LSINLLSSSTPTTTPLLPYAISSSSSSKFLSQILDWSIHSLFNNFFVKLLYPIDIPDIFCFHLETPCFDGIRGDYCGIGWIWKRWKNLKKLRLLTCEGIRGSYSLLNVWSCSANWTLILIVFYWNLHKFLIFDYL